MRRTEDKREGQESIPVRDRAAEVGINLNTIFTALVLAGIVWVGTTLESIRDALNKNAISFAVLDSRVNHHINDPAAHARTHK